MRLLLIDGHYYLYRSFYAIRDLRNSRGEPTNAIFGYIKALRKMLADLRPDRAAVIWDGGLPERRTLLQPAYKTNRKPMPDDLRLQAEWLQSQLPLFGLRGICLENTEADDLIASYAQIAVSEGAEVIIATNDKDLLQLVSPHVHIYSTALNTSAGYALLGEQEVQTKWGVSPSRIADILALTGDASDNILGVPGIGNKTAAALITQHGSVNDLLANPEAILTPRIREKILNFQEQIIANLEMVRLDRNLSLPMSWNALTIQPIYPAVINALRDLEFYTLLQEVQAEVGQSSNIRQQELFGP